MAPEGTAPTRGRATGRRATAGRARGRGGRGASTASANPEGSNASAAHAPAPAAATSAASSTQSPAPTRGDAAPRATRGPTAARFRPRNIRRDEAARDQLARQELVKDNAKAKEEARRQARSRGRSRRSRGDLMGRGGTARKSMATGPFSQFLEGASSRSSGYGSLGGGGGGGGGSSSGGFSRGVKNEGKPGFKSHSRRRDGRINADRFAGLPPGHEPDSEDEATADIINENPGIVWPMGIMRVDRKEEKKALATSAELEAEEQAKEEESLWVDGEIYTRPKSPEDGKAWHAAPDDFPVKTEPGTEDELPDIPPVDFSRGTHQAAVEGGDVASRTVTPDAPKLKKPAALDPEMEQISKDMKTLLSELGPSESTHQRDGRLYLFQFPPVLPPLEPVPKESSSKKTPADQDDVVMVDQPGNEAEGAAKVKTEEGAESQKKKDEPMSIADMAQLLSEGGRVGKLNVRRSGKVEMDWGGRTLELAPATDLSFLTKAVIVEQTDEKPKAGAMGGEAVDMGKVMGRFVLAPVWGDEEEWVVDPADLEQ